jgi:hypothetical protein
MSAGDFSTGLARLHGAIVSLEHGWTAARQEWLDETALGFEQTHLRPLLQELNRIVEATAAVNDLLTKARRACGPRQADEMGQR